MHAKIIPLSKQSQRNTICITLNREVKGEKMIAIPLNEKSSVTLSNLYGNAPYFAMLDMSSGAFHVVKNKGCGDGEDTAKFIVQTGATSTLYYHMGEGLFKVLNENKVDVYSASKVYLTLEEIYTDFYKQRYKQVTINNATSLLDVGNCGCKKK